MGFVNINMEEKTMKKRILSVLLLIAMLLTMIPFAAAAEEVSSGAGNDANTENETEAFDYESLYVKDGLVNLFTVYGDDNGLDLSAATWTDKLGGAVATLYGTGAASGDPTRWKLNADGSFGFDVLKGAIMDEEGTFDITGDGSPVSAGAYLGNAIRLDFGLAMLPEGSFTVEYMAKYKPLYVRDMSTPEAQATIKIATDAEGNYLETYDYDTTPVGNYLYDPPVDRLGWFASISQTTDGVGIWSTEGTEAYRGQVNWAFMWQTWGAPSWNGGWVGTLGQHALGGLGIKGNAFQTNHAIRTYAIAVDETVTGEGGDRVTSANLLLYRDGAFYNSAAAAGSVNSTANGTTSADIGKDPYHDVDVPYSDYPNNTGFYLSHKRPTDFYTVRIYNRALTAEEYVQNAAVDTMQYYGITMTEAELANAVYMKAAYRVLAAAERVIGDELEVNAAKEDILADLAIAAEEAALVEKYASPEDMTAFFSVFAENSIDLAAGTWRNLVGLVDASFANSAVWTTRASGAVGFDAWAGYIKGGAYTAGKSGATFTTANYFLNNNTYLDLNLANLSNEDFTVEYTALYRPLLIADADKSTADTTVYYEVDSALVSAYDQGGDDAIPQSVGQGMDGIGWLYTHSQNVDGPTGWYNVRGAVHWLFACPKWNNSGTNERFIGAGSGWGNTGLVKNAQGEGFHKTASSVFTTYGIYLDETVVDEDTQAEIGIYRDGVAFADNKAKLNSTANIASAEIFSKGYYYFPGKDGLQYYETKSSAEGYDYARYYSDDTDAEAPVYFKKATGDTAYTCYLVADDSEAVATDYFATSVNATTKLPNTTSEAWGSVYFDHDFDENASFYLSKNTPTDFFGVRVYNRALTAEEKLYNRFVDVLVYYDITVSDEMLADAVTRKAVISLVADKAIVADPLEKAEQRASILAEIEAVAEDMVYVNQYAAPEHMTSLFTVFKAGTVDLVNGTWRNLLGSGNATIGNKDQWRQNDDGSFGYDMYYGTYIDKVYTKSTSGDGTSNYFTYGTRLDLGIQLLPADDFTLEYLADLRPYYVTDGAGNLVYDENNKPIETFVASGGVMPQEDPGGNLNRSIARIGYLQAFTYDYDGIWNNSAGGTRGTGTQWKISGTSNWGASNGMSMTYNQGKEYFHSTGMGIRTYAITRAESDTNQYAATYVMYKDGAVFTTTNYDGTTVANASYIKADFSRAERDLVGAGDANLFWLSERLGTDFYTVRIYDKVLTLEEQKHNIAIDLINFYGIELAADVVANETLYAAVLNTMSSASFVTDPLEKASVKAELEGKIDAYLALAEELDYSDSLYVTEGLTSFFTAFGAEAESFVNASGSDKIWYNRVLGEANATFKGGNIWSTGTNGGVGKHYIYGTMDTEGTFATTAATGYTNTNIGADYALDFGKSILPKDDYTVEYLAFFAPKYAVQLDAEGNPTDVLVGHYTNQYSEAGSIVDKLGFLQLVNVWPGGTHYQGENALHPRMGDEGCTTWGGATGGETYGFAPQALYTPGRTSMNVDTYAVTRDETATYTDGVMTKQTAQITLIHNVNDTMTQLYDSDRLTTKGLADEYKYFLKDNEDQIGFYMSKSVGVNYYAVRIYDRVLTAAEQTQNRAADIIYYLGLELPESLVGNAAAYDMIIANAANISPDALESAALKEELQVMLDDYAELQAGDNALISQYADPEHLTSLFSIFREGSVNLASGTWRNLVGGANATFGNKDQWSENANGSVGFNMYYGTVIDGTYTASVDGDGTSNYFTYGTRLNLGISLLPADDFTVEYLAQYKPYYVTDGAGNLVPDANGNPTETYNASGKKMPQADPGGDLNRAVIRMGYLQAFTYNYDGAWNNSGTRGTGTRWTISGTAGWSGSNEMTRDPIKSGVTFVTNEEVRTYTISRTEDAENKYAATYDWYKDGKAFYSTTADTSSITNSTRYVKADFSVAESSLTSGPNMFWLSERHGTDFYVIRIYDKVLTEDEKMHNIFVDKKNYYGIEIPLEIQQDAELYAMAKEVVATAAIATDAFAKAEKKAEIEDAIAAVAKKQEMLTAYAATENLQALYTTFLPGTFDLETGTWIDSIGGATATFGNKQYWLKNEDGSVGFNTFHGTIVDGVWESTTPSTANLRTNTGTRLNFGIDQLPDDDFTVDYTANYKPIYVYDANQDDGVARDAAGNKLETYTYFKTDGVTQVLSVDRGVVDNLGWFQSRAFSFDQNCYADFLTGTGYSATDNTRGSIHWTLSLRSWSGTDWHGWLGGKRNRSYLDGLHIHGNNYHTYDVARTYAIKLDETVDAETEVTSALFALYRDGGFYESNVNAGGSNSSDKDFWGSSASSGYFAAGTEYADAGLTSANFWLSAILPVDFYTVRIYDKALTEEEIQHNHMVDLLYYYDLELDEQIAADADLTARFAAAVSGVMMSSDPLEAAVAKLAINDAVKALITESPLYDLYVEDGLVAHFSSLVPTDITASVAGGVWKNRIEGAGDARINNNSLWFKNPNGSFGYNLFYGEMGADGVYTTASAYNTFNNTSTTSLNAGTNLSFAIEMLPEDDFTVEFVAMFKPIYVADTAGDIALDENGNPREAYIENDKQLPNRDPGGYTDSAVLRIGYLQAFAYPHDSAWGNGGGRRGDYRWVVSSVDHWSYSNSSNVDLSVKLGQPDVFFTNGTVRSYAITRTEDAEVNTKATYGFVRDGAVYGNWEFDGATVTPNVNGYVAPDFDDAEKDLTTITGANQAGTPWTMNGANRFLLSERHPTDFYAVRIYDRVLLAEEYAQNHAVDVAIYYGLDLGDEIYTGSELGNKLLDKFIGLLANAPIVTTGFEKIENKATYQAAIDQILYEATYVSPSDYDALYVQNGLVGLYTSFVGDTSVDVVNGIWTNKATSEEAKAYGNATLNGRWSEELHGVGYRIVADNHTDAKAQMKYGLSLSDSYENLDNFTTEVFATVYGVTTADGERLLNAGEPYVGGRNNFRFGILTSLGFSSLHSGGGASLRNRWALTNIAYTGGSWTAENSLFWSAPTASDPARTINNLDDSGWLDMSPDRMVAAPGSMQVTKATDDTNVNFKITYNNSADPTLDATVSKADHNSMAAYEAEGTSTEDGRRFSFFNVMPATVYAVRVYDRVLSREELLINSFVDKAAYYQIEVDSFAGLDEATKNNIASVFARIGYNKDVVEVQALYNFYAGGGAEVLSGTVISFEGYAPILASASGYRVIFEVNKEAYDLLVNDDYTVTYGALVAPGGEYNSLEDVTLENENVQNIVVCGEGGSELYYKPAGAKGYYYSAAITADDSAYYAAGMIVRGYVTVTKGDENYVVYTDAALNGSNEVSILDAADYFVNAFDGDIVTQYTYMNSAVLRAILDACGYSARVSLADDLTIYVDAESGDDENNGLTEETAYKTIGEAFAAAKAHFAKTGRKAVTIRLAEGTYTVTEELKLTADDILADGYSLDVIGVGDTTVLTTETEIAYDEVLEDAAGNRYVQVAKVKNADGTESYPYFRALYANGELVNVAGSNSDETSIIDDFYIIDAEGNVLDPVQAYDTNRDGDINEADHGMDGLPTNDWCLNAENFNKAVWAVFRLPAEMFDVDNLTQYADTELHYTWTWELSVSHIDHVVVDEEDEGFVLAYVPYGQLGRGAKSSKIDGKVCWIANSMALASTTDGYYYDSVSGKLYYNGLSQAPTLTYAALENVFVFENVENISISNLAITGVDSDYLTAENGIHLGQAASATLLHEDKSATGVGWVEHSAIFGRNLDNFMVSNVSVYDVLGAGVTITGNATDIIIDSSRFENLGASAIHLASYSEIVYDAEGNPKLDAYGNVVKNKIEYIKDITITNNYVNKTGALYTPCASIMAGNVASAKVIGNTVIGASWSAFSFGLSWAAPASSADEIVNGGTFYCYDLELAYNYVTDVMTCQGDGGAFYLNGGAVSIASEDSKAYNRLHHNYVVMSELSGLHGENEDGWRNVYCYYFENSTSNWLAEENVLVNEVNTLYENATFYGVYLQTYNGGEARHVTLVDNYFVGFESVSKIYNGNGINPDPEMSQVANDYVFEVSEDLADNILLEDEWNNAVSNTEWTSDLTAEAVVVGIFKAAGSDISDVAKKHALYEGLDVSAYAPAEREIWKESGTADVTKIESIEIRTATFTDGETTIVLRGLKGATVKAPAYFAQANHNYTFRVNGEVVDLANLVLGDENITVDVESVADTHKVTFVGGIRDVVLNLFEGDKITMPEDLKIAGKTPVLYYDGALLDLNTFKMPDEDIEVRVEYKDTKYTATFVDAEGNVLKEVQGYFGNMVGNPGFALDYHTTQYTLDGDVVDITKVYFPEGDLEITVEYVPNLYTITFKAALETAEGTEYHTYGTVDVTFGATIDASAIETPDLLGYLDGYSARFVSWNDFVSGESKLNKALMEADCVVYATTEWVARPTHSATFTGDGVNVTVDIAEGDKITIPAEAQKPGYNVTLYVGGDAVDLETYRMPAEDVTFTLEYTAIEYTVTITDGEKSDSFTGAAGSLVTFDTTFAKDHFTTVYKVEGEVIDLATYTVTGDAAITVEYVAIEYTVTITDGENTVPVTGNYGDALVFDAATFTKDGFTTVYKVEGEEIDIAEYTTITGNLTIDVEYVANEPVGIVGDYNNDGAVDAIDVGMMIDATAEAVADLKFDLSGDGAVDAIDVGMIIDLTKL